EAAKYRKRVLRQSFVDELAARFGLAVQPSCQLATRALRGSADEDVGVPADNAVAFGGQLVRERLRLVWRVGLEPHFPRREALREDILLGLEFLRRLVVPPVLVREPVLDSADACLGAELTELGLNDGVGALGLGPRARVDEQDVLVARNGQSPAF